MAPELLLKWGRNAMSPERRTARLPREEAAMFGFSRLGPIEITCNAPSYKIVQACRRIGFTSPEDVRWCRLSEFAHPTPGWKSLFQAETWKRLLAGHGVEGKTCSCGANLPILDRVTFTFTTGLEATYMLGQCSRCQTVFWEES
jgi:hypothetical protein